MKDSRYFTPAELAKLFGISKQLLLYYDKNDIFHRNSWMKTATDFTFYRSISLCRLSSLSESLMFP